MVVQNGALINVVESVKKHLKKTNAKNTCEILAVWKMVSKYPDSIPIPSIFYGKCT